MGHQQRLNEIAAQHGLRPLLGSYSATDYIEYALDLTLVGLGLMKPEEAKQPQTVFEEYRQRTGKDWTED